MKKNISVRILTALGGLTLLALGMGLAAEAFLGVQVTSGVAGLLIERGALAVLMQLVVILALLVMAGAAIVCALPRRQKQPNDFVMQRGENGEIGISVRAIEKQVRTCVAKHDVIADAEVSIRESREGLIILLNVDQVAGVNIPLSVGLLQKQVKQYVSSCTGVDVHEVRVMVENNTTNVVASPFAVQESEIPQVRPMEENRAAADPIPAPQPASPAEAEAPAEPSSPAGPVAPVVLPEIPPMPAAPISSAEEDERPLHQRIFGAEEQPVIVPTPPEMMADVQPEPVAEAAVEPESETELLIDADVDAAAEAVLPQEAAEAGAAYSEALWADENDDAAASIEDESEEPETLL